MLYIQVKCIKINKFYLLKYLSLKCSLLLDLFDLVQKLFKYDTGCAFTYQV